MKYAYINLVNLRSDANISQNFHQLFESSRHKENEEKIQEEEQTYKEEEEYFENVWNSRVKQKGV